MEFDLIDVIRARYKSDAVANVSAAIIVLFFAAMMVAQFVGGAKLFEAVTGYSYIVGLALFGIAALYRTLSTYDTTVQQRVAQERAHLLGG